MFGPVYFGSIFHRVATKEHLLHCNFYQIVIAFFRVFLTNSVFFFTNFFVIISCVLYSIHPLGSIFLNTKFHRLVQLAPDAAGYTSGTLPEKSTKIVRFCFFYTEAKSQDSRRKSPMLRFRFFRVAASGAPSKCRFALHVTCFVNSLQDTRRWIKIVTKTLFLGWTPLFFVRYFLLRLCTLSVFPRYKFRTLHHRCSLCCVF